MQTLLTIIKKQGVALLILGASFAGVIWIVKTQRPPGSMTVVEAQAMDMTTMKAPIGVIPVGADYVLERNVGGSEKFPATIAALSDEDVVARIPGLVKDVLVYPGDRVTKGQLLATLEADEFDAKALAGTLTADAKQSQAQTARDNLQRERAAFSKTRIDVASYEASVDAAKADLRAAENNVFSAEAKVRELAAKKLEALAQRDYARADYEREKDLFDGGAISRDDLDKAKKLIDTADAKVAQVDAQRQQTDNDLEARKAKRDAAANMVKGAEARLEGSKEAVNVARSMVSSAQSSLSAKEREAGAARAAASASGALSSYTELRARDDGVVTERLVSPGTPVMPGMAVLRLKVDRQLRVQADLPQRLASSVKAGSAVRITSGGETKEASITSVFPYVEGRTRTFRIEAVITNTGNAWQVGSYAEMEVFTSAPVRTLSVRNESVKTGFDGSHYVWVAVGDDMEIADDALYTCTMHPEVEHEGPGDCPICKMALVPQDATGNVRAEKRVVKIGPSDSFFTSIREGLEEGELVTWAGDEGMYPGAAVKVVEWNDDGPVELPMGAGVMMHGDEEMSFDEHEGMDMGDDQMTPTIGTKST
ncbi:MAG: efflux RND transporter periplasmic adaptor subunit, partial [Armatimonadetes bacterium]|nr:efflux RND transporter periplasmic adaptor subunit [Armatimonadota bacterium]